MENLDTSFKDVKNQVSTPVTMRTIRFHDYGEPTDVLRLEEVVIPEPGPGRIRVSVRACGLNPVDWGMCRGHFAGQLPLPRGIGLDVSGIVDAIGEGVTDVAIGDAVLGAADFMGGTSAGASDRAIMYYWFRMPVGLDFVQAAALPMAVETAYRGIDSLGVRSGQRHNGRLRRRSDCPHARCSCGRNRWCHLRRQTPCNGSDGDLVR
ncbi:alcohol dehydrogenase catalytic domain-containing protein [Paenibacillus sp. GCM10027628]|uniref:alcohol dehydrogenase catalytic domain-containing protein n=1 Tax=Paenibacillus sp. GCM10027628 TaxID=3273413 RepID=UPI003634C53E